jgi:hypothetical protein
MGPVEFIRIRNSSKLSAVFQTQQLGIKSIFVLALLGISGAVAARVKLEIELPRTISEHVETIGSLLAVYYGVLLLVMAIPGVMLLDGKSTELRLTGRGIGYALLALLHWYGALACLLFACSFWTFESLRHFIVGSLIGGVGLKWLSVASESFALAKRHMMRSALDLLSVGGRPPILYLRSFADDDHISAPGPLRLALPTDPGAAVSTAGDGPHLP